MCTLILLDRVVPGIPVVVAANRDEFFARKAAPPALSRSAGLSSAAFVAPRDLEAGGTWMGVNENGLFVGLTNRRVETPNRTLRSRGLLVQEALGRRSVSDVLGSVGPDAAGRHNPFHLLAADGRQTALISSGGDGVRMRELPPGIHVVGNRDEGDPASGKVGRVRERMRGVDPGTSLEKLMEQLAFVLSDHGDPDPYENPCVHLPEYGTRSSALIALGPARRAYWVSDGPPCRTDFTDCSPLLDELQRVSSFG